MIGVYFAGLVNAVVILVTTFGLNLSTNQIGAIGGVTNAIILLVAALLHLRTPKSLKVAADRTLGK